MTSASRGLTAFASAAIALAALASNGPEPLRGDYRLKVVEPVEGATIPGGTVRVRVELEPRPREGAPAKNSTPTPLPPVDIFLDRQPRGTLKNGETTLLLDGVAPGTHTLLATATDESGVVFERKEVHFTVLPPSVD